MAVQDIGSDQERRVFFEVFSTCDANATGHRLGRLAVRGRKEIKTPNFIAVTSRGVVPHITPDAIAAHAHIEGVHMALEDYIERASHSTPPIMNCPGTASPLDTFTALAPSIVTFLAPRRTPAVSAPNGNTKTSISLFTSTGFQVLTNSAYVSFIRSLRPDIAISLADVPHGVIPGRKRISKMSDRTKDWLSELLRSKDVEQAIFAPVLPADFDSQSEYLNYLVDDLVNEISGLAFYDSNLLPEMPGTSSLSHLVRLSLDEPSSPHEILRQILLGMDIFAIPFVGFATDAGIALTFRFPGPESNNMPSSKVNGSIILPLGIDMWSTSHSLSLLPLSTSCSCYTCTSHHRAYVQHLLSAKEMLGWVLLQIHNHHIISSFFSAVQDSIGRGTFHQDCEEFNQTYESDLPEKSGQGPRARGYHFKTEGPGEERRNKAAWGNLGGDTVDPGGELDVDEGTAVLG